MTSLGAFTRARIFLDVDSIPPGRDFTEELAQRVDQCDIFLAVIGRHWADVVDIDGGRRLDNPNDWVRVEIELALRLNKYIIPVLVDGAEMPPPAKLPESLRPLTRRNATRLTHERFRADAQALVVAIGKLREDLRTRAEADLKNRRWPPSTAVGADGSEEARSGANAGQMRSLEPLRAEPTRVAALKSMRFEIVGLGACALAMVFLLLVFFFRSPPVQPPPAKSTQMNEEGRISGPASTPAAKAGLPIVPQQTSPPAKPAQATVGEGVPAPAASSLTNVARPIAPQGENTPEVATSPVKLEITVPGALTTDQIVQRLRDNTGLVGDVQEVPREGSLMPDTYFFERGYTRQSILSRMAKTQAKVVDEVWNNRAGDLPIKSPGEMVTLASIVDKETSKAEELPRVARVFLNRLRKHMRLESDATIVYGLGSGLIDHSQKMTAAAMQIAEK